MKTICRILSSLFKRLHLFFERHGSVPPNESEKKLRLRQLLSRGDLAADEKKELSVLVSEMEGDVIFLDPPLQSAAKEDL